MKIFWMSDSPTTPTGYGNATHHVCTGLAARGHDVSILGWDMRGQPTSWHNCMLYPGTPWYKIYPSIPPEYKKHVLYPSGLYADGLLNYLLQLQPDVLITQGDIQWFRYIIDSSLADFMHTAGILWILYYSIDSDMGENLLPSSWVHILKSVDLPIAMSRFGHEVTQANEVEAAYIPHGVDTKVFQPPADKERAKQALGCEGKFVILSNARNQLCKMVPRTLEIFRRFALDKDGALLHLHCDPNDTYTRSPEYHYDLRRDIAFLDLTKKVCLTKDIFTSKGMSLEQLVPIYQAADVHLLASWGEGFGLPTLQAAATGVVPLASDYTASKELVTGHGEAIRVRQCLLDQFGLRRALIDIDDTVSKLEMLYRNQQLLASKAYSAREFALSYDWEHILPQWEELLLREVSRKRMNPLTPVHASASQPYGAESSSDLAHAEHKTSELETDLPENTQPAHTIRIPVTLPLVKSKQRIPGYVYVASQCDVPSALALRRIFPGLKVWSTVLLDFDSLVSNDKLLQTKVVEANGPEYRPHLALSTLAMDISNCDPRMPVEAAKLGVPCIGLAQHREQAQLWPELSLEKPDPLMAAELGRQMLTDQGVAADVCLKARRQLLTGKLIPANNRPTLVRN